jgi:hypothetical protein
MIERMAVVAIVVIMMTVIMSMTVWVIMRMI